MGPRPLTRSHVFRNGTIFRTRADYGLTEGKDLIFMMI